MKGTRSLSKIGRLSECTRLDPNEERDKTYRPISRTFDKEWGSCCLLQVYAYIEATVNSIIMMEQCNTMA